MATLLQLALPGYLTDCVRITFGAPIAPGGTGDLHTAVVDAMQELIGAA